MSEYTGTDNLEIMENAVNYNAFLKKLVLKITHKNESILDFGAGIGTFAKEIEKDGFKVHCLETDQSQANEIKATGLKVSIDLKEINDESLDYIYSLNVLEHIEDDSLILKELKNKLKNGGKLLVYVPAFMVLFSSMDEKVKHYRRYTKKMLSDLAIEHKLKILDLRYVDSLGFFVTLLYKLIGNNDGDINTKSLIIYDRIIFPMARIFDRVLSGFLGKNVYIVLEK